jgi:hypothetical protein
MVGQLYTIELWVKIVPDPAIPGENVSGCGLDTCALTIMTSGETVATEPNMLGNDPLGADTTDAPQTVDTYFPNAGVLGDTIHAARQQAYGTQYQWGTPNTGLDAIECALSVPITTKNIAVKKAFLFAEENWLLESLDPNVLHLEIAPTSNHWDSNGNQVLFSQLETGTLDGNGDFVPGTDLGCEPCNPEPATLALLGVGAMATMMRRPGKVNQRRM